MQTAGSKLSGEIGGSGGWCSTLLGIVVFLPQLVVVFPSDDIELFIVLVLEEKFK